MDSISNQSSEITSKGVGYVYQQCMLNNHTKIAQIDGETGEKQDYKTLLERCTRTAITMQNKGIKAGQFISICSYNHLDSCVPYIASLFIGAVSANVEPGMSVQEIVYLFKMVLPKMIFVSNEAVELIEKVMKELGTEAIIVVFGETTSHASFSDFLISYPYEKEFKPKEPKSLDETSVVIFSSGTSGKPKGICHTHNSMLGESVNFGSITVASFSSLYWSVFHIFLHLSIINGCTRLVFDRFDFNDPWKILKYNVQFMFLNPIQAGAFLKHEKPAHIDVGNLAALSLGGNYSSKDQIMRIRARFPKTVVHNSYGQSEIFTSCFRFFGIPNLEELSQKYPDSVGVPNDSASLKIVDIDTQEVLGPNQIGELRIKMKSQTKGYYNCDSSETFDSEGWLKSGDLCYYNEDNCYFIVDRIKASFKYLNQHIIPTDIETVLLKHPAVKEAAVIGVPHETDCNHPMGVVVLNKNYENCNPKEIIKFVEENSLDKNRLRAGLKIVKNLPFTTTNKIQRYKLKQMVLKNVI